MKTKLRGPAGAPWALLAISLLSATIAGGCVSKAKARADAHAAYLAGRQEAMRDLQQRGPAVTVTGPVRNPMVPWTPDLTLARAIVLAEFYGQEDPKSIVLTRSGEQIHISVQQLLRGDDFPVQAGDSIQIE